MPWKATKGGGHKTSRGGFVRNTKQYEALRKKGMAKAKAARIANSNKKSK